MFKEVKDKRMVLSMKPWSFDSHLLAICDADMIIPLSKTMQSTVAIRIQLHDLPFGYKTIEVVDKVGGRAGEVVCVDTDDDGIGLGFSLSVHVKIDLSKPL